jgi:hypothetical protein
MTRDFVIASSHGQIQRLVQVLAKEMALSPYSDMRKGGLIGLSAVAVALGKVTFSGFALALELHVSP